MKCDKCDEPNLFTCYMMHNTLPKDCIKLFYEGVGKHE